MSTAAGKEDSLVSWLLGIVDPGFAGGILNIQHRTLNVEVFAKAGQDVFLYASEWVSTLCGG
ncbi:hypothetical protein [Gracilimonas sediminicola]|uniref:Uncharacterized protein n=1 Tax=Gracilimonas sediminicola TaxID=2952158 RepID=A0A9X2RDZ8_9BACT|nr:hypothetical protein [Gracilimonas sediminicola]MCP9291641.1 hypothetical protein [Gracilimonas sediminicola]